jgi:PAS domain S-box-containing protein
MNQERSSMSQEHGQPRAAAGDLDPRAPSPRPPAPSDQELFRRILDQLRDYAIFCMDPEGRCVTWSRGVERLLGYSEPEFIGLQLGPAMFLAEDVAAGVPQWEREEATREGASHNNRWMKRKDGSRLYVMGMTTALRDEGGLLTGFVKVMQDRTLQHEQARELREKTEQLLEANAHKDRFLAVLSHELRNPLAPIRTGLEVLAHSPPGSEHAQRAIAVIDRQSLQLTRLVDDLLDMTRITQGRVPLRLEGLELNELVRRVAEDHSELFSRRSILLRVDAASEPLYVRGDRVRMIQIVGNLLDNALKFTADGGRVTIGVSRAGSEGCISIADDGAGMSPETITQVFEPFVQAELTADRSQGGLGLGLALVRGLVAMHEGQIVAESAGPGMGSRFVVKLPLRDAWEQPQAPSAARLTNGARRVLIIEDNSDAAELLSFALVLRGHEVAIAEDGPNGIQEAARFMPDVVLCDLGLPGMDGYTVAAALRAQPALRGVFLVALTGYARTTDLERTYRAGFDEHVAKPAEIDALARLISSVEPRARPSES